MKKRGYILPENYVPKIPKNITQKSIDYLKRKNEQRYHNATDETGKKGSGLKKRQRERSEAGKKGAQTRQENKEKRENDKANIALQNLRDFIDEHYDGTPETTRAINELHSAIDVALADDIDNQYAILKRIEQNKDDLIEAAGRVLRYKPDTIAYNRSFATFIQILKPNLSAKGYDDYLRMVDRMMGGY